jgi:hypothetical protein
LLLLLLPKALLLLSTALLPKCGALLLLLWLLLLVVVRLLTAATAKAAPASTTTWAAQNARTQHISIHKRSAAQHSIRTMSAQQIGMRYSLDEKVTGVLMSYPAMLLQFGQSCQ